MNNLVETVFKEEITQKGLNDLKKKYPEDLKIDMSDDAEFKAARKTRTEKNKLVEAINRRRLDITTELKNYSDSIIDTISTIYDVVTIPFETEDQRRKDEAKKIAEELEVKLNEERTHIRAIGNFYDTATGKSSEEISEIIEAVDLIDIDGFDKELIHEAIEIKKVTLEKLDALLSDTKNREILNAEREKLAEEAEAASKKAVIVERLNTLKMIPTTMFGKSSEDIGKKIIKIKSFSITVEEFGDLADEGKNAITTVVSQLENMETQQKTVEEAEASKQQQAEERGRIAKEAAEKRDKELAEKKVIDELAEAADRLDRKATFKEEIKNKPSELIEESFLPEDDLPFTSVDDHLETKEDILSSAFNDWSNSNHLVTPYVIADMRLSFEAGVKWATSK